MPIQPLGDRLTFYQEYIQGCRDYWRESEGDTICYVQIPSIVNFIKVGYKDSRSRTCLSIVARVLEKNKRKENESWYLTEQP